MAFNVLHSVVFVTAGPDEVEGHTRKLLINSHNDRVLFRADGEQTLIGPDKLRITGALMSVTCHRYMSSVWGGEVNHQPGPAHFVLPPRT